VISPTPLVAEALTGFKGRLDDGRSRQSS
jgi:hypothetical protein